jgi:REP element-mobilizing transposase RayT
MQRMAHRILVISVAATHCHFLVELPDDLQEIRRIVGECKRSASMAVKKRLPGRVWAHDGKYKSVDTVEHQRNTFGYIKRQRDAWIWSYDMDEGDKE